MTQLHWRVVTAAIATSWQDFRMQRNGRPGAEPH